jgi:hypothetical protein
MTDDPTGVTNPVALSGDRFGFLGGNIARILQGTTIETNSKLKRDPP